MSRFEYKVVPAPKKGRKVKGVRSPEGMFSHVLQELMNELAEKNWEYQRAEMLPSVERSGLASTTTEWRHVLVFRRVVQAEIEEFAPELLPPPAVVAMEEVKSAPQDAEIKTETEASPTPENSAEKSQDPQDNGVEATQDVEALSTSLETLAAARKAEKTTS